MKPKKLSLFWLAGVTVLVSSFFAYEVIAGERWNVGTQHPAASLVAAENIDHGEWDRLLRKYVDKNGMIDYQSWKSEAKDTARLDKYLNTLSRYNPQAKSTRPAELVFWINAYNAVTIKGILREHPTSSIRNHTATLLGYNIWDDLLLVVGKREISLNDIEHKVLRKLGEPRIHFAIVCASIGCPPLLNEAYHAEKLDEQLTKNTRRFFADPAKLQYDPERGRLEVSPIIKWFAEDFGKSEQQRIALLSPYIPETIQKELANKKSVQLSYLPYDWNLNEQKQSSPLRQ